MSTTVETKMMAPLPPQEEQRPQSQQVEPKAPYFYYRDHSHLADPDPSKPVTIPGRIPTFPAKLLAILSRPDLAEIISWMPHGRSWKVHKPREFEVKVIPSYFDHAKFSSFIRQANGWGFKRVTTKGTDRNSHYHELFLRGMPHLIKFMKRPLSGTKALTQPQHTKGKNCDPNFYKISEEHPLPEFSPKMMHPLDESSFLNSSKNSQMVFGAAFGKTQNPTLPPIQSGKDPGQSSSITQLQAFFAHQDNSHRSALEQNPTSGSHSQAFLLPRSNPHKESARSEAFPQTTPVDSPFSSCPIRQQEKDLDPLTILLNDLTEEDTLIEDPIIQSLINDPSVPPPSSLTMPQNVLSSVPATMVSPAAAKSLYELQPDMSDLMALEDINDESIFENPFASGLKPQDFF